MTQTESEGVTPTENFLVELCGRSFFRLWSYANPFKDDGHEFCDVLAVFEGHVFIFFDREKQLADLAGEDDPTIRWNRWKRNAVDKQVHTAHGAERYLRSGRKLYLDAKKTKEFPVSVDIESMTVHKVIVAHGAAEACKSFSTSNVYGSLAIIYADLGKPPLWPFMIDIDRKAPVHVFDSHNLPIILNELDTIRDFSDYLDAKIRAIASLDMLSYCGEEDLLAHYWLNADPVSRKHYIGTSDPTVNAVVIGEGEWRDLLALPQYAETKRANQKSYLWDEMIQRTCDNWRAGILMGDGELLSGRGAIHEMAKEPRFMRREIVERIGHAIEAFPERKDKPSRYLTFFGSYYPKTAYVFLQIWVPPDMRGNDETYRAKRQEILRIACGVAKNRNPSLEIVVGISIPPPKLERELDEDFIWLDCSDWPNEIQAEYQALNSGWNFFETGVRQEKRINEFILPQSFASQPTNPSNKKVGRNQPCPCGSGKKFKRCHGS